MSAPVTEGDIVLDKYRVERILGQGGMGVVVAATHVDLEQRVALKFLLPEALAHPELVERFAREARAAAKIQSQHVARVIDTGRMPSGAPFMVMEYLEGKDLADVLEQDGRLTPEVAVDYVLQACEAIAEAHAAGIVHRDLKPANLFLARQRDRRAIVKVLDFGISKVEDPKAAPLTRTATMMGSPHYMSPEQLTSSKNVDARTDIWALGVILYELTTGLRPFEAETMPEIVAQILKNEPPRLSEIRPDLPFGLQAVVTRCLASAPANRFASVAELATALEPLASDAARMSVARISRVLGPASIAPPAAVLSIASAAAPSPVAVSIAPTSDTAPTPGALPTAHLPRGKVVVASDRPSAPSLEPTKTAHSVTMSKPDIVDGGQSGQSTRRRWPLTVGALIALGGAGALVALRSGLAPSPVVAREVTTTSSAVAPPIARDATDATAASGASIVATATTADASPEAEVSHVVLAPSSEPDASAPSVDAKPAAHATVAKPAHTTKARARPPTPTQETTSKSPLNMGIK